MTRHLFRTEPLAGPLVACLASAFFSVFTISIADPDLWGHVRYGADMIGQGSVFITDPYSYLSGGFPWINHELLCELTLGFLEPRFGAIGLQVWKCGMGVVTVGCIVWSHRRRRLEPVTIVLIAAMVAMSLRLGWVARPQVFTYTFVSLLALMMTEHERWGRSRALWFAPPLMIAWTNSHGGFVAGLCLLLLHIVYALCKEICRRATGWKLRSLELVLVVVATASATLVNPYGVALLRWVRDSLTWPRPEISEWSPVPLWTLEYMSFKMLVLVTALSLALSRRSRRWGQVAMLVLTGTESLLHQRHIPLFAILVAFWVPEHLDNCMRRLRAWLVARTNLRSADVGSRRLYAAMFVAFALVFGVISVSQARTLRVDKAEYPVSAFQFVHERGLSGRMVTEFNWGQYCLYAFWPRILISTDGRFDTSYSREALDLNFDFMIGDNPRYRHRSPASGPFCRDRVLDVGNPSLALVNRQRNGCVRAIEQRLDWVLLYQDALAQVWGRRSVYDDPRSPQCLPAERRSISDEMQFGWVSYPALPRIADYESRIAN